MFYALFMSRRRSHRRTDHSKSYYSDSYGPYVTGAALLLMLFCVLDSYFTLLLIQYGSIELNPILAWALQQHVLFFFLLKYSVTAVCVVVAVMHKQFPVYGLKGSHILMACLLGYGILIHYQLAMLLPVLF
ncbi:MAG: hypothetical protein GC149_06220 [Gammaproteobacteria bacterium]|nr:hypothetical protein [Gammaproteobacteria bacterium]